MCAAVATRRILQRLVQRREKRLCTGGNRHIDGHVELGDFRRIDVHHHLFCATGEVVMHVTRLAEIESRTDDRRE